MVFYFQVNLVGSENLNSPTHATVDKNVSKNAFWPKMQNCLKCEFPTYLINIMSLCGFDNSIAITQIEMSDIHDIEKFARSDMQSIIGENSCMSDFYGIYQHSKDKLKRLPGHVKIIFSMKNYLLSNPKEDFSRCIPNDKSEKAPRKVSTTSQILSEKTIAETTDEKGRILKQIHTWVTNTLKSDKNNTMQKIQELISLTSLDISVLFFNLPIFQFFDFSIC